MKFSEFLLGGDQGSLIGKTISGKLITKNTKNEHWEGDFDCYSGKLTSLEGAPTSVGGDFCCGDNKLTSLGGIHKIIKKMNGVFYARDNDIKSHVLGLLLIPGCEKVDLDNNGVQKILNKYLPNTGGNQWVMQCQTELIEAGYREYAKL